ncbi:N-acetylmuramoyl-L-alanine amidase [Maricaulaceae bacterium EIL42A08]|nr:N-acetylmuramoyl-L-alanine amidase [Maricaulaceae bacterium EIL42A08]
MTLTVTHRPSPNFNDRKRPISALVLHYTGMESGAAAIERLCDPDAGVSAHYVVEEDGSVLQLVAENKRAWHAGVGSWRGETDLNSASIGIEIVNGGHDFGLPAYPEAQIAAMIALAQDILSRHAIPATGIIGHSDMAPGRKQDPGEHFPWQRFAGEGIGLWPDQSAGEASVDDPVEALVEIGYPKPEGDDPSKLITAFQRRFMPAAIDGLIHAETQKRIGQILKAYRPG